MKIKLINEIEDYNRRRKTLNRTLLIQAPVLFLILLLISNITITPYHVMAYSMLFWFYWIYLGLKNIVENIRIMDDAIVAEFRKNTDKLVQQKTWNSYLKRINGLMLPLITITILFAVMSLNNPDLRVRLLTVSLIIFFMFIFSNMAIVARYISVLVLLYNVPDTEIEKRFIVPTSLLNILIKGFVLGLPYLFAMYKLSQISTVYCLLYYFVLSCLLSLSFALIDIRKYFMAVLKAIDSFGSGNNEEAL